MSRNTWRNIFIGIIFLTIPCYLLGIFVYYNNGGGVSPTATPTLIPSRTPINPTTLALTNPALIVTEIIPTNTSAPTATATTLIIAPVLPSSTPLPFMTATFVPPTNTPFNTAVPANTQIPTATQPILLPPTDTPSP